jgi:hypothetical protein
VVGAVQSSQERQPSRTGRLPRRFTDRVGDAAAWALTAVGLFVLLWGVLSGLHTYREVVDRGRVAAQEQVVVDAVLLTDGVLPSGAPGSVTWRPARYVDAAGHPHDVVVAVVGRPPSGGSVRAWVDRTGHVVPAPPTRTDALVLGGAAATGIVVAGWLGLVGLWLAVRRWLGARNAADWAREWARVEPEWSGRAE